MTVYNLPKWLRQYTLHKTLHRLNVENGETDSDGKIDLVNPSKEIMKNIHELSKGKISN